ncbi:MAG: porin, partial [Pseudomonadota bacterium]
GLNYTPTDAWSASIAVEFGQVEDDFENDFDRQAVSLGLRYQTDDLTAAARFEYRVEEGERSGDPLDTETLIFAADASYKISEDARVVFALDSARTETAESGILDGEFTEVALGYAYRPTETDRFNVLARYRYFLDLYGQRVDGTDEDETRQRSHVLSIDASYDLTPNWTLGGKLGYRLGETSASEGEPFIQNDAVLTAVSLRYQWPREWDALVELRNFQTIQGGTSETSVLAAAYRQFNDNIRVGVGYNFGTFTDDLTDLSQDNEGIFLNIVAAY